MAFLNKQERERLESELKGMKFGRAAGKLRALDPNGRLVYYRNAQETGELLTRYELKGLGARVTLVEIQVKKPTLVIHMVNSNKTDYDLIDVNVEPTADNRL